MLKEIINQVYWAGINDWELRQFHGYEYSTHHGSSYNSYLIREEKTVLIDTVFSPFANTFIENSLKEAGFEMIAGPSSSTWEPDKELLNASFEFGKAFIESFKTN